MSIEMVGAWLVGVIAGGLLGALIAQILWWKVIEPRLYRKEIGVRETRKRITYRGVEEVPDEKWAKEVVDWGIECGVLRPPTTWLQVQSWPEFRVETNPCPECKGEGGFYGDSMDVLGIPGGWVPDRRCEVCKGTGIKREKVMGW